jgi:hypothetical protein
MGSGEIRDFGKLGKQKPVRILSNNPIDAYDNPNPQRLDSTTPTEGTEVEIRIHEEQVTEDDKLRRGKKEPGEPEVRVRVGDTKKFEKVKRLEDE